MMKENIMKKHSLLGVVTLSALTIVPLCAQATMDNFDVELSANVALVSDYSFRGISQSDEGPAIQGGFDIAHDSGIYAGVWGSNVDFNDGDEGTVEIDGYVGFANEVNGVGYDVGAIYYAYPGADDNLNYDFWEASFALGYDFDLFSASASVNYSPEFFGETGDAQYYALGVDAPLSDNLSLSAHVGHQEIDEGVDYTDWSLGLSYGFKGLDLSVQYVDTNLDEPGECADGCDSRVVFGISRSF